LLITEKVPNLAIARGRNVSSSDCFLPPLFSTRASGGRQSAGPVKHGEDLKSAIVVGLTAIARLEISRNSVGRSVAQNVIADLDTFTETDRDGVVIGNLNCLFDGLSVADHDDKIASVAVGCD
jgi:hypothetical protein